MNMRKKRPDFFAMDEFLRHKLFALVRSSWMHYSGTTTVDDLIKWVKSSSEIALRGVAERIHQERMSSEALEILSESHETDEVLRNTILQSRDLLQFYSKFGPSPQAASWQAHAEMSPAIPILSQLAEKVEDNLIKFKRTRVHKEMAAELDISRLASRHLVHKIHELHPDRTLDDAKDRAQDYVLLGEESLMHTKWLENLNQAREDYQSIRATKQEYRPTGTTEDEIINDEAIAASSEAQSNSGDSQSD
ncbi:hypothetical protein FRC11_012764 [Ceratobasidium sp. 423]|nr:hypothetical protein FRC11_012764 [Ceratobasidium sp. 423]